MARISQPGRTRLSGSYGDFAGFWIGDLVNLALLRSTGCASVPHGDIGANVERHAF
jgi:hypothetical protein